MRGYKIGRVVHVQLWTKQLGHPDHPTGHSGELERQLSTAERRMSGDGVADPEGSRHHQQGRQLSTGLTRPSPSGLGAARRPEMRSSNLPSPFSVDQTWTVVHQFSLGSRAVLLSGLVR